MPRPEKSRKYVEAGLFFCLSIWGLYLALSPIGDDDVFFHIAFGREMVENGNFLFPDKWTHTNFGEEWSAWSWMFAPVVYFAHETLGITGLIVYKVIAIQIFCALLWYTARRISHDNSLRFVLAFVIFTAMYTRFSCRAELIVYSFFLAFTNIVVRALRANTFRFELKQIFWMHAIFLLWFLFQSSTFLAYFWFAAVAATAFVLEKSNRTWKTMALCASLLIPFFCHPDFLKMVKSVPLTYAYHKIQPIAEYQSPTSRSYLFFFFVFGLAVTGTIFQVTTAATNRTFARKRVKLSLLVLNLIAFGSAALLAKRNIPYFAIACLPNVWPAVRQLLRLKQAHRYLASLMLIAALGATVMYIKPRPFGTGLEEKIAPEKLASFIEQHPPPGKMYNTFNFACYLLWRFNGTPPVYTDIRTDLNAGLLLATTMARARGLRFYHEFLRKNGVTYVIYEYPPEIFRSGSLPEDFRWFPREHYALVFHSAFHVVLVDRRCSQCREYIAKHEIEGVNPFLIHWGMKK